MDAVEEYIARVARHFKSCLGSKLLEAYKLGSLAHGGFSVTYSDIDFGLLLNCNESPAQMSDFISGAKSLDTEHGKKLSVFWGNPNFAWGRLPVIDRLDLLDHGVPLLDGIKADFRRPSKKEIHQEQRESIERSWKPRLPELSRLPRLEPRDRKPYIRAILYPARLIYTWDHLAVASNDCAVAHLRRVQPPGLDLQPIDQALDCRNGNCTAEDVFALHPDLDAQYQSALAYISG